MEGEGDRQLEMEREKQTGRNRDYTFSYFILLYGAILADLYGSHQRLPVGVEESLKTALVHPE